LERRGSRESQRRGNIHRNENSGLASQGDVHHINNGNDVGSV